MADEDARTLLKAGTHGVLSGVDTDGAPYGVPLNYVYSETEDALFFHCAMNGRKVDCIRHKSRVCFTVVGRSDIDAAHFTTRYASVIAEGCASFVQGDDEKRLRLRQFCDALTPGMPRRDEVIEACLSKVAIVRVDLNRISGKANRGEEE
jgi:nitroimidazol reductase NimA-like FMN-containing flavoprotein (pyridoxamine 5'-phosphate oxidase superfamily)